MLPKQPFEQNVGLSMKKVASPKANACNKQAMSISKGKRLATIAIDKVRPTGSEK